MSQSAFPIAGALFVALVMLEPHPARAACMPLKADVVSLGEKPARYYAERSINAQIESEKETAGATGRTVTSVSEPVYDCKPFPNILGADEWRCTAVARVCAKP
jgi:hypothetical protein